MAMSMESQRHKEQQNGAFGSRGAQGQETLQEQGSCLCDNAHNDEGNKEGLGCERMLAVPFARRLKKIEREFISLANSSWW